MRFQLEREKNVFYVKVALQIFRRYFICANSETNTKKTYSLI